jgi:HTH-type transcriptional regulator/antitoxin HigA
MTIRVLKTDEDYQEALFQIDQLIDCAENSEDESQLELLGLLVHDYERHNGFELPAADPITVLKIRMEKQNLRPKDLVGIIGDKPAVSKVLSGKKNLTLPMIKRLHDKLNIPYNLLIV